MNNTKHRNKKSKAGFTIVEVLVALAVGGIMIGTLSRVVSGYTLVAQRGRHLNNANAFVEAKVEEIRNNGYNSLPLGTTDLTSQLPSKLPPSRSGAMTVSSSITGLKQIDINVSYKDQGQVASQAYTTYIGELGVGQ